jgi:CRP/FNR family cyclic AMP-dependent transcriptional regulator
VLNTIPKERFRTLLADVGRRMGLSATAVEQLVRSAQLGRWSKGQSIFSPEDTADFVNFLVTGVVKVSCPSGAGTVCVQLIRPGQFFGLNWYMDKGQPRLFSASAFTDATVAIITNEMMGDLVAQSPPPGVLQIVSYSWRVLSRLLYEKCCLLGLRLEERLIHELAVLARDFGRDAETGILIDLPLTHADLAEFALGSRANVARVMKRFEREGLVGKDGRKIVLSTRFFDPRYNAHVNQILRGDLLRVPQRSIA